MVSEPPPGFRFKAKKTMALQIVTLSELTAHCNALQEDAELLTSYGEAAEASIVRGTRRSAEELLNMGDGQHFPAELKQAVLILAAHWYRVREAVASVAQAEVPFGLRYLVTPFRKYDKHWRQND